MKKNFVQCASVPAYLTEDTAREIDDLVKTLPSDCGYFRKAITADIQFEPGERSEVSIINTSDPDREGEVILPTGIQMEQYRKNAVVLFNHNHDKPVARCTWVKLFKDQIRAKTNYDLPENVPDGNFKEFVEDTWAMVLAGVLKGKSVGLLPLTSAREPTPEELAANPNWEGCAIRDNCIMLEYSVCVTPVNANCLVEAVNNKSITAERLQEFGFEVPKIEAPAPEPAPAPAIHVPTVKEIMEAVLPHLPKPVKKAKPKRKPIDVNALFLKALEDIDIEVVLRKAQELYKSRGRV